MSFSLHLFPWKIYNQKTREDISNAFNFFKDNDDNKKEFFLCIKNRLHPNSPNILRDYEIFFQMLGIMEMKTAKDISIEYDLCLYRVKSIFLKKLRELRKMRTDSWV